MKIKSSTSGEILIVIMWILAIMIVFVMSVGHRGLIELKLSKYYSKKMKALYLAKAGYYRALAELEQGDNEESESEKEAFPRGLTVPERRGMGLGGVGEKDFPRGLTGPGARGGSNSFNESWANNESFFKEIKTGDGTFTVSYTYKNEGSPDSVYYGVMDEQSKFNINRISKKTFENIVILTDSQINSIMDWIDTDSEERDDGAEESYYQNLPHPYNCANRPFKRLEELLLVKGITPDVFLELKDIVTVYGDGRININTVSPEVMRNALGFSSSLINKIISFRKGNDATEGTRDDKVFSATNAVSRELNEYAYLTAEEGAELNSIFHMISVGSAAFRIISQGESGGIRVTVTAVVERQGMDKKIKLRYWHEK